MKVVYQFVLGIIALIIPVIARGQMEIAPEAGLQAVEIFNTLDSTVGFHYRFEDDRLRHEHIAPHSLVYIYDENPKHDLILTLRASNQKYKLETEFVHPNTRDGELNRSRFDQARPYHLALDGNGTTSLYKGFPPLWTSRFVSRVLQGVNRSNVDVKVLTKKIDPAKVDVLGPTLEFIRVSEIVGQEYERLMCCKVAPALAIDWMQTDDGDRSTFTPRIRVCGCDTPAGRDFLANAMEELLKDKIKWEDVVIQTMCCASISVRLADLNPAYVSSSSSSNSGRPNMTALTRDVMNYLTRNTELPADHIDVMGGQHQRVNTVWRYFNGDSYRYKLLIDIKVLRQPGEDYGVELKSLLVVQKRLPNSDRWSRLADFAIYKLGSDLQETIVRDVVVPPSKDMKTVDSKDSFVVKYCRDVSIKVADLITRPIDLDQPTPAVP